MSMVFTHSTLRSWLTQRHMLQEELLGHSIALGSTSLAHHRWFIDGCYWLGLKLWWKHSNVTEKNSNENLLPYKTSEGGGEFECFSVHMSFYKLFPFIDHSHRSLITTVVTCCQYCLSVLPLNENVLLLPLHSHDTISKCMNMNWHLNLSPYEQGCIELLDRSGVTIEGKDAVVLGRSNIVGTHRLPVHIPHNTHARIPSQPLQQFEIILISVYHHVISNLLHDNIANAFKINYDQISMFCILFSFLSLILCHFRHPRCPSTHAEKRNSDHRSLSHCWYRR